MVNHGEEIVTRMDSDKRSRHTEYHRLHAREGESAHGVHCRGHGDELQAEGNRDNVFGLQ